ncbi:MAG TPA: hypothetical protein VHC72_14385 [Bryobacteraceae bacterium]|nr:hypothetical protein [Bryobacteraceae bacterium]
MASTALELVRPDAVSLRETAPVRLLPVPWRDPHSISATELAAHIRNLEKAVVDNPESADLKTCLGMAYAMDYRAYRSMDVLQAAAAQDPNHFFAQFKLAELFYRLRALPRAEEETLRAVALAGNGWELGMARRQLQEIRLRIREGTQKPEWNKSLKTPAIALVVVTVCLCLLAWLAR